MDSDAHTISCAELDRRALLRPDPPPGSIDPFDQYAISARRAQIHLELRMEMQREAEQERGILIATGGTR